MDIKGIKGTVFKPLVEGYEFATQLQDLLSNPFHDHHPTTTTTRIVSGPGPADELLAKILASFHQIISVLDPLKPPLQASRDTSCGGRGDDSPAAAPPLSDGLCEDSGDSRKRPLGVNNNKGKRGCYKRKRKSQTWTVESRSLDDPHAWRKYGQKEILHAKYPRSYFRCTHKYTQGCKAIKQVQKLEHDPGMFQITYIGSHSCNPNEESTSLAKTEPSEIVMDSDNVCILSHCDDTDDKSKGKQEDDSSVTILAGTLKEEDANSNGDEYHHQEGVQVTEDLSLVWQDIMAFEEQGVDVMDLMVFGNRDFALGDDDLLSFSDAYHCI